MKTIKNICILCLLISPHILVAQEHFVITGEIDERMNDKTIKLYQILPSFSSLMPGIKAECVIKNGKFSFGLTTKGYESFGFQMVHNGQLYNQSIKSLPQNIKITFLDTLLKSYIINDQGFNDACKNAFADLWKAENDTASLIKVAEEYIQTPFASCLLFWLTKDLPEHQILRLYSMVPDIYKQNSWSIDLEFLIAKFLIGKPAPDFTQQNPDGKSIHLSDYRGKYVLLDFWASWCIPCRKDNPNLVKAYVGFNKKGFEILSVSLDVEKEDWVEAIKKDQLNWQHVSDLKGWENSVSRGIYKVRSVPQNYLINPEGIIIAKNLTGEKLLGVLNRLLNK